MTRARELAELAAAYDSGGGFGFRNRIINPGMVIDQRNAGASVNPSTGAYTLDRWNGGGVHDGVLAIQRVADAPTGFVNSLRVTVTTADSSLGSTQYARVGQIIEGFNVADLAGGTASAATVTLSFWVKSTLTGTFGGYLSNGDETRAYVFQYTINAANTWEQKTVTVTLPASGTWATDNTAGMRAFFSLGSGSTYINTANTWLTSIALQASGNVNVINTLNATWQVTGVQLEKGSTATSFDYRPYGTELALCQRYFYRRTSLVAGGVISVLQAYSTTAAFGNIANLPVTMRATPTASVSAVGDFNLATSNSSNAAFTAINLDSTTKDNIATGNVSGSSGLVAGNATCLTSANSTGYINASAEL
jgi:hypothetical protein